MAKNIDISVPFTNLSVDILKRYLEGRLSTKERTEVEKQLKEDPLAADALEGLRALENPDLLLAIAPAMQRDTRLILARKRHKKFIGLSIRHYVMAAAVIMVMWLSFSIFRELNTKNTDKQIAQTNTAADSQPIAQTQEMPTEPIISDTATALNPLQSAQNDTQQVSAANPTGEVRIIDYPASTENNNTASQEEKQALAENKALREDILPANATPKPVAAPASADVSVKGGTTTPSKDMSKGSSVKGGNPAPPSSPNFNNSPSLSSESKTPTAAAPRNKKERVEPAESFDDDMPQKENEASLELKAQDVNMATGMNEFNAGNYAKAAESFKKILMASVFYPESRFRLGQCQLALKDYLQAVNTFKSIGRKSPFYFQAQWELSQIYLSQGDKEKAKKILLQISKEKNPYQNQAVQKLVEIH